jgi:hypothetical protein
MSTPIQPSEKAQQRDAVRNSRRLRRVIKPLRSLVERAVLLGTRAQRLAGHVRAYDANTEGFRARVAADRADWLLLWVFWGVILCYAVLEFMTSGDIAEVLAYQMAPHVGLDPVTGQVPIWLRRVAGVGFVGAMLLATLLVKLLTSLALGSFKRGRLALEDEEGRVGQRVLLGFGVAGVYLVKLVYVAAVAGLYFWLFGFAQERAATMAILTAEEHQTAAAANLGIKIEGGSVETTAPDAAAAPGTDPRATITRLSGATGVFYVLIVMLHALVLLLPTNGFSRELELAHFKRAKADARLVDLRQREGRLLREIFEHVRTSPTHFRDDLVQASEPVHAAINQVYRRPVIGFGGVQQPMSPQIPEATGPEAVPLGASPTVDTGGEQASVAAPESFPSAEASPQAKEAAMPSVDWEGDIWGRGHA